MLEAAGYGGVSSGGWFKYAPAGVSGLDDCPTLFCPPSLFICAPCVLHCLLPAVPWSMSLHLPYVHCLPCLLLHTSCLPSLPRPPPCPALRPYSHGVLPPPAAPRLLHCTALPSVTLVQEVGMCILCHIYMLLNAYEGGIYTSMYIYYYHYSFVMLDQMLYCQLYR